MNAWVQFKNISDYSVIYIKVEEDFSAPIMLVKNMPSRYYLLPAGSVGIKIFDGNGHQIKSILVSILPAKLQTVFL